MLADVDSDGTLELIANSLFDGVYVWNHEGELLPGWPFLSTFIAKGSPAVADIDGDGSLEIAVAANFRFYIFRSDGTLYPGWGGFLRGTWPGSATLYDIDQDGDLEILVAYNAYSTTPAAMYVWHHDGSLVSGWPQYIPEPVKGSPVVADLDNDGQVEIVLAGNFDHNVYVWRANGELFPGWPQHDDEFSEAYCSASVGDVDGDGDLEIISAGGAKLFVRHYDGTVAAGWPQATGTTIDGSPALADVDGDGDLEIFLGSTLGGPAYGWHHDGTPIQGWPIWLPHPVGDPGPIMIDGSVVPTPAIGDVNGDGTLDVIIADSMTVNNAGTGVREARVFAYRWDGVPLGPGWPKVLEEEYQFIASPVLADVDADGDIEVAIGTRSGAIHIWDEAGAYNVQKIEWPMFRHDLQQTGSYHFFTDAVCGNGVIEGSEECDGMDDTACPGACLSDCTCGPFCGNSVCYPGEDSCHCPDDCGTPPSNEVPGATCADGNDNDCDGLPDSADPDCAGAIPTVSEWGLIVMALLLLTGLKIKFGRCQPQWTFYDIGADESD